MVKVGGVSLWQNSRISVTEHTGAVYSDVPRPPLPFFRGGVAWEQAPPIFWEGMAWEQAPPLPLWGRSGLGTSSSHSLGRSGLGTSSSLSFLGKEWLGNEPLPFLFRKEVAWASPSPSFLGKEWLGNEPLPFLIRREVAWERAPPLPLQESSGLGTSSLFSLGEE